MSGLKEMRESTMVRDLQACLGMDGYIQLCQELGGQRIYVPYTLKDDSELIEVLGRELAEKFARRFAPCTIRVPLAKRERALHFRSLGMNNAQIARKMKITESGVYSLFKREHDLPDRPGRDKRLPQLDLFQS